jgi:DNA-directed RNA polymerase subunit RPC12/RpoP
MEPIRFKCAKCGSKLRTNPEDAGATSSCPKCGNEIAVPFPGLRRWGFWGCKLAAIFVTGLIPAGESAVILLPIFLIFGLLITYFRTINIGLHPAWTFAGLIPFSIFYFGFVPEGHAKKK